MSAETTEGPCEIHGLIYTLRELVDEFDVPGFEVEPCAAFFRTLVAVLPFGGFEESLVIDVVNSLPHPPGCGCPDDLSGEHGK